MKKKLYLMTAHHKNDGVVDLFKGLYNPVQVGSSLSGLELGITRDDSGKEISYKNQNYCELTAHYWAWKNIDAEYIGLMHYRRIFTVSYNPMCKIINWLKYYLRSVMFCTSGWGGVSSVIKSGNCSKNVSCKKNIFKDGIKVNRFLDANLSNYDVVLPKPIKLRFLTMKEHYSIEHNRHEFELMVNILLTRYPEFEKTVERSELRENMYCYNMFIMKSAIYNDYMEKLFTVLGELECLIDLKEKDPYQSRVFGFLAERFLNFYVDYIYEKGEVSIYEMDTLFLTD